ncbi:MAG TPA: hypothetical protein VIJ76_06580 [Galbitalea sp.]
MRQRQHTGAKPPQLKIDTRSGAYTDEPLPIDEKMGVMDSPGRAPRHPLGQLNGQHACEQRFRNRVNNEKTPWPKHSAGLFDHAVAVGDVFEDLAGADNVNGSIGEWRGANVSSKRHHAMRSGKIEGAK